VTLEAAQPGRSADRGFALMRRAGLATALVAFAPVIGLAAAQGGYFPSAWNWATLPLLWLAALALALRERVRLSWPERVFLALLAAVTGWILLSATWSVASAPSILESQRALLYVAGVGAVLVVARNRYVPHLLGGLLAAICAIAAFSLATRLFPDRVGVFDPSRVYRLAQPIGYWNGLALFAGMGALLAVVFSARARSTKVRAASAALLVLLLPTFYFTFGRGAWIALAAGLIAAVAVDARRLQLLAALSALAPAPVAALWLSSRQSGLTRAEATFSRAVHDGHRLAVVLLVLAGANAAIAAAFAFGGRRLEVPLAARRAFAALVALAIVAGLTAVFVRYGGPVTLADKGYAAFKAPPPHVEGSLNRRLLSFSGNGRADLWRLAWEDARKHPVLGAGAGTYERYFLAHQPAGIGRVRDAHGLYIETLAELGPLGLFLLVCALLVPLAVLGKARAHPLVPGAVGAYVAYLVHTGVDWHWELPAVTLAGLLCGTSILLAARPAFRSRPLSSSLRWTGVGVAVAAAGFAVIGLVGNNALSRSDSARADRNWSQALSEARVARSWMPWSPKPWEALGRAQLGAGAPSEARKSLRKAISMDRGDWELWYYLGSASSGEARTAALRNAMRLIPQAQLLPKPPDGRGSSP
jgi:hypothetical protein